MDLTTNYAIIFLIFVSFIRCTLPFTDFFLVYNKNENRLKMICKVLSICFLRE